MNVQPFPLRGVREQMVLAQCEAFAVILTLGELEASKLGGKPQPAASASPAAPSDKPLPEAVAAP